MSLEARESQNLDVLDIVNEARKEENKLSEEIDYKLPEQIWGYKIVDTYPWFLKKGEKWFAIELSKWDGDEPNIAIIVKYVNWKIEIRDTQQEPYTDAEYNTIKLEPEEQSQNDDVNKINKYIKDNWFNALTNSSWDISQLWSAVEYIKK